MEVLLFGWLFFAPALATGAAWEPTEASDQRWKTLLLHDDGGLKGVNIFGIDFEKDTADARYGTAWIATSDGLREYDGFRWRRHGKADGLPSDLVRCVLVTRAGSIWVGTDRGAGIYDGKSFRSMGSETNLAGPNVRRISEDADGSIWFCSDSWPNREATGGLTHYQAGKWRAFHASDGLPGEYVVNTAVDRTGRRFVATLEGVGAWNGDRWEPVLRPSGDRVAEGSSGCFAESPAGGLLYSTGHSLYESELAAWIRLPSSLDHSYGLCSTSDGRVFACGRIRTGWAAIHEWGGGRWNQASAEFEVPRGYVEDIREAPDGALWVVGYGSLVRWPRQTARWREFHGVGAPVLTDSSGRLWFSRPPPVAGAVNRTSATLHNGIWTRLDAHYSRFSEASSTHEVWGWGPTAIGRWTGTNEVDFTEDHTGLRTNITGAVDGMGRFWMLGFDGAGRPAVASCSDSKWVARPLPGFDGFRPWRHAVARRDGFWFGGTGGTPRRTVVIGTKGGTDELEVLGVEPGQQGVLGAELFVDKADGLWLYGDAGLFRMGSGTPAAFVRIELPSARRVDACIERADGVWFQFSSTIGGANCLGRFMEGVWTVFPLSAFGTPSLARNGDLLFGGSGRIYRIPPPPLVAPVEIRLPVAGTVESVVEDQDGKLWISVADQVLRFRSDGVPAETEITGPRHMSWGQPALAQAVAVDRFRPRGYRDDHRFSWRLDGGDWSLPSMAPTYALNPQGLRSGQHVLEVRSCNAGNIVDPSPASLRFHVHPQPIQEQIWFLPVVGCALASFMVLAAAAGNARRKLALHARVLEDRVAARTQELASDIARREVVETELRRSKDLLRAVVEGTNDAVFVKDREGKYLLCNEAVARFVGRSVAEVLGRDDHALFDPASAERIRLRDSLVMEAGCALTAEEVLNAAGVTRTYHATKAPYRDERGGIIGTIGISRDITERRRSEHRRDLEHAVARAMTGAGQLEESISALLRAICESEGWVFASLWEVNQATDHLRCVHLWHSPGEQFRALAEESRRLELKKGRGLPGQAWESGTPIVVDDVHKDPGFVRKFSAMEAGVQSSVAFPIRVGGHITGVLDFLSRSPIESGPEAQATLTSIGSQIGQFFAREKAQKELQRFVAFSPAVLYALRVRERDLSLHWVSDNITHMTGFTTAECFEPSWWADRIHPADRERILAASRVPYTTEHLVVEFQFRRKDGTFFWVHDERRLVRDEVGVPTEVIGTWTDVTSRVALEAELRQAQKLEAIGLLSGGIAHDFNNILASIIANTQLAMMDLPPDHPVAGPLHQVQGAGERAAALVRQILTFARQGPREPRHLDLRPIVGESLALLRATIPAGVDLVGLLEAPVPAVVADENQIQQVLLNLCTNAWHALEGGSGRITVQLAPVEVDLPMAQLYPDLHAGSYVRLSVQDTGKGMDSQVRAHIFEPFFSTKEPGKGTGLGLSVVHGIVLSHKGAIVVESAPGKGSRFDLYFPAVHTPARAPAPPSHALFRGNGEHVLVLDDEPSLARTMQVVLRKLGYAVSGFEKASDLFMAFQREPEKFRLLVTDLNMPGMSGIEVARTLKLVRPALPVLLTSGFISDELREQAAAAGISSVLRKPATVEALSEAVRNALGPTFNEEHALPDPPG